MPSLDLNASLNYTGQSPTLQQNQQMGLGLTLTFPLFSGLSTVHEYRSNRKLEEAAQKTGISVDFDTLSQIRQTFYTFQESTHKLKVDLTTLNAATIRATIARKRYNTGLLVFEQWDIIENDLINRQKSALASKRDRIIAESSFRQALGLGDLP